MCDARPDASYCMVPDRAKESDKWSEHAIGIGDVWSSADLGQGGTTCGVMDDIRHNSTDVAIALSGIELAELGNSFPVRVVGLEDAAIALTLGTDDATHLWCCMQEIPLGDARNYMLQLLTKNRVHKI